MEKPEVSEVERKTRGDMKEYGMDYDVRLSVRVHKRHLAILDGIGAAQNKNRGEVVREVIEAIGKRATERGII